MDKLIDREVAHELNRRSILTRASVIGAAALGAGLLGGNQPAEAAVPVAYGVKHHRFLVNDIDILNFALNSEYLAAEFYLHASSGTGLTAADTTGVGTLGNVTGGSAVPFATPYLAQFAAEVAADELGHVRFLREVLGKHAVARPAIDIGPAFTAAAVAAGVPSGSTFSPYTDENSFLLGGYVLNDVDVTAYVGSAKYIRNPNYVGAAAGLLGVEGYHAAEFRTVLFQRGQTVPALLTDCDLISTLRNKLSAAYDGVMPTDQGITNSDGTANIVPTDGNSLAFGRSFGAVLNIVYANMTNVPTPGGFFPAGFNGRIR